MRTSKKQQMTQKFKAHFKKAKNKVIKYLVTGPLGVAEEGEIRKALLLFKDEDSGVGLVFHPRKERHECDSLELCRKNSDGLWVSWGDRSYVNLLE